VIHSGVNRRTRAQAGVIICIQRSIKNTIINYTHWSKRKTEVKLEYWKREIIIFLGSTPQQKEELKKTKNFTTNYRKITK
jgi:hypothetical protein